MENKLSVLFFFKTSCTDAREREFGDVDKNIELYQFASTKKLAVLLLHSDRFLDEMFQNHGLKEWISLKIMLLGLCKVIMSPLKYE